MAGRLDGKIALVTGASSGLGKATALAFSEEGARLALAARREAETQETASLIRDSGGEAIVITTDVSIADQVATMVDQVVSHYGRLDVAFNNAGVFPPEGMLHEVDTGIWDQLININLRGTFLCMQAELKEMVKHGGGAIVNMASSAGLSGWADNPIYAATKHGVVGLTRSTALQYAPSGIRINAVCPAFTQIEAMDEILAADPTARDAMAQTIPLGRIGQSRETAEAVVWLASESSSFCVGHALALDGGQTIGLWR